MLWFAACQVFFSGLAHWYHSLLWVAVAAVLAIKHARLVRASKEQSIREHADLAVVKGVLTPRRFSIKPECVTESGQRAAVTWKWSMIEKLEVWEQYLLLYSDQYNCGVVLDQPLQATLNFRPSCALRMSITAPHLLGWQQP